MAGHRILHVSVLRRVKLPSLIQLLNSDKTQPKRFITVGYSQTSKSSYFTQDEKLSRIPVEKLKITYSRSSGPGGQHVNKTSTKAEVRFHVQTAEWIPDEIRQEILLKNKSRINKVGELIVTSEISRSQHKNLEDCLQKICEMIAEACHRPPEPTEEDVALRSQRLEKRNLERLKQKKTHSGTKQARRVDFD